jgi:phage terminase large subunit-like protein
MQEASFACRLAAVLEHGWRAIARPNQLPPAGEWRTWLLLAGRGFGKTHCIRTHKMQS